MVEQGLHFALQRRIASAGLGEKRLTLARAARSCRYRLGVRTKDALKFLASVIAHEQTHAIHGASEAEAYAVQIETLKALKAPEEIVRAVAEAAAHVAGGAK